MARYLGSLAWTSAISCCIRVALKRTMTSYVSGLKEKDRQEPEYL